MEEKSLLKLNLDQSQLTLMKKIKYLINAGADINEKDHIGHETFLFKTIDKDLFKTFKFLLANKADLNITNDYDQNILLYAIEDDKPKYVKYLLLNHLSILNINQIDREGNNPIILCLKKYHLFGGKRESQYEILKLLMEYSDFKINIWNKDNKGQSIENLMFAINDTEISEMILNYKDHMFINPEEIKKKRIEKAFEELKNRNMPDLEEDFTFI